MSPRRGEVWLVRFDPSVGAEQKKTRPAVVLSVDAVGRLPLRIVVPVTDWKEAYAHRPWFVYLDPVEENGLAKPSGADGFQVKSVAQERFVKKLGSVSAEEIKEIAAAVALCIGVE